MPKIKRMDIKEFREKGYLQEANRLFFHRIGLALEIIIDECGEMKLGGIWDFRDDPEGILFQEGVIDPEKAETVRKECLKKVAKRVATGECSIDGTQKVNKSKDKNGNNDNE